MCIRDSRVRQRLRRGHCAHFREDGGKRGMNDPRTTPARPDLAALHLKGKVEAARFVEGVQRRVIVGRVPLHAEPTEAAIRDTELLYGETFTVYDTSDGWAWGQAARDGYVGYAWD